MRQIRYTGLVQTLVGHQSLISLQAQPESAKIAEVAAAAIRMRLVIGFSFDSQKLSMSSNNVVYC